MTQSRSTDPRTFGEELSKTARDAAYVAVGLGVLGFQRAQVRRRELMERLAAAGTALQQQIDRLGDDLAGAGTVLQQQVDRLGDVPADLASALSDIDDAVESVIAKIEAALEPFEQRLPAPARDAVQQARTQAQATRRQIRTRVRGAA